jgi:hypothetical protein
METTYPVTPKTADVMMIGGRQHVLYHGLFEPLKIVDAKYLWLNSVGVWLGAVYVVALVFTMDYTGPRFFLAISTLALPLVVAGFMITSRGGLRVPIAVEEKDRSGTWSRMIIHTHRNDPLTVTAHTDMADFLLATVENGQTRRFLKRPVIPLDLRNPGTQRHVWIAGAGTIIFIPAYTALIVSIVAAMVS